MCKAYVMFEKLPRLKNRKTDRWQVNKIDTNINIQSNLGMIRFSGAWRQFIFEPSSDTYWSHSCLDQISGFLKEINKEWREGLKR